MSLQNRIKTNSAGPRSFSIKKYTFLIQYMWNASSLAMISRANFTFFFFKQPSYKPLKTGFVI